MIIVLVSILIFVLTLGAERTRFANDTLHHQATTLVSVR